MPAADRPLLQVHVLPGAGAQPEQEGRQGGQRDDDKGGVHGRGPGAGGWARFAGSQQ